MLREYPNIGLLEYIFHKRLSELHDPMKRFIPDDDVYMFPQIWPNTGGGLARPGFCYGDAMTKEYTTVLINSNDEAAMVAFGNKPAYIVMPITAKFIDDLQHHRIAGWREKRIYEAKEGDLDASSD